MTPSRPQQPSSCRPLAAGLPESSPPAEVSAAQCPTTSHSAATAATRSATTSNTNSSKRYADTPERRTASRSRSKRHCSSSCGRSSTWLGTHPPAARAAQPCRRTKEERDEACHEKERGEQAGSGRAVVTARRGYFDAGFGRRSPSGHSEAASGDPV